MSPQSSPLVARYSAFPKSAWICVGMAALMATALVKFVITGESLPVPYLLGAIAAFLVWPALTLAYVGTLELTATHLRGRRRAGFAFDLPRAGIAYVQRIGSRRFDTRGVEVVLLDGTVRRLVRVRPLGAIDALIRAMPPPT